MKSNQEIELPFRSSRVWIDVRTPQEYAYGHIPGAHNIPLFTDDERTEVGTIYIQKSREEAIRQGLNHVGPRLTKILDQVEELCGSPRTDNSKSIRLYCARGGMRSGSVAWLLRLYGYDVEVYGGGYKAFKSLLSEWAEKLTRIVVIGGATGSGKTDILHELHLMGKQVLDLEGLACHKGSAFGVIPNHPQPHNDMLGALIIEQLAQMDFNKPIYVESESKKIGSAQVPDPLFKKMRVSNHIEICVSEDCRVKRIVSEYGQLSKEYLIQSFTKISKRLGAENTEKAIKAVQSDDIEMATRIALRYYDKAYSRSGNTLWQGRSLGQITMSDESPKNLAQAILERCSAKDV